MFAGFLTAMRQEVTRAHKGWALDMVTLHNEVTKFSLEEIKAPPPVNIPYSYVNARFGFVYPHKLFSLKAACLPESQSLLIFE